MAIEAILTLVQAFSGWLFVILTLITAQTFSTEHTCGDYTFGICQMGEIIGKPLERFICWTWHISGLVWLLCNISLYYGLATGIIVATLTAFAVWGVKWKICKVLLEDK